MVSVAMDVVAELVHGWTMAKADSSRRGQMLSIYLNDHLAGATAGAAMFERAARSASAELKAELARLTAEVQQDRRSLLDLMSALDVQVRRYKMIAGWLAEKAGRAKLNGYLLRRSPLTDLVEVEALLLGVQGKAAGFRVLRSLADRHPGLDAAQLDRLIDRAERQAEVLERLRLQAAQPILPTG